MRVHLQSDHGAPCWKCSGMSYGYAVDDSVNHVNAWCVTCGADNMFVPPRHFTMAASSQVVAAAHRAATGWENHQSHMTGTDRERFEAPGHCDRCQAWTMHWVDVNDEWHCVSCGDRQRT